MGVRTGVRMGVRLSVGIGLRFVCWDWVSGWIS